MNRSILTTALMAFLFVFSTACSEQTSSSVHNKSSVKNNKDVVENKSKEKASDESKQKGDQQKATAKKVKPQKPQDPFKALTPQEGVKPLKSNYSKDELELMPLLEAHGDTRERSVPFGQTLQHGGEDHTQGPLKHYRLVAFYGNPHSKQMGILGQLEPETLMTKLKKQAQAYSNADPTHPAIPTLELITTIAQRDPGPNQLYYHMTPEQDLKDYEKLAKDNGAILLLDVQLGRDSILHQVKLLEDYLKLPNVYLAIDTEFHVKEGQTPGVNLGHVDGKKIQEAINYVSTLTKKHHLPDKVVIVHQFKGDIIANKEAIKPTQNTEVAINYDGFGSPGSKLASYHGLIRNETVQYGGFKLFYKNDQPLLTPKDVIQLDPAPAVIDYQ
ncbi:hypothetical protein JOD43_000116 [Pullulanibacillus pueri]|uniref:Lipoprotein n=1 Tax=Pullulanibacillus pueri TaxID=1437324 RepID=A0A8J2ZRP3_9BACL|nr:hypothetical protein [Pullulanibacillus pueri]MBM7679957.1 hypothetical protein [Pullulanibacillus pueri]GGH73665.1 hypothetical protein GCM10007096_01120 [Pullulanibacillus pueri]